MYYRLSHDVVTLICKLRRFDASSGDDFDWLRGTIYITMVGCDWCISIPTVLVRSCSLSGPLLYHSFVVFLDCRHPRFGNYNKILLSLSLSLSAVCLPHLPRFGKRKEAIHKRLHPNKILEK